MDSSAAKMTLQGVAIQQAAIDFGNGQTLPFTPCKRGYIPIVNGQRMYACSFHDTARSKRLEKDNGVFRDGEVELNIFWNAKKQDDPAPTGDEVEEDKKKDELEDEKDTKKEVTDSKHGQETKDGSETSN